MYLCVCVGVCVGVCACHLPRPQLPPCLPRRLFSSSSSSWPPPPAPPPPPPPPPPPSPSPPPPPDWSLLCAVGYQQYVEQTRFARILECCSRIICVLLYSHTPKIPDSLLSRINVKVSGLCETDEEENVLLRSRGGAEEGSRAEEVREQCVGVKFAT